MHSNFQLWQIAQTKGGWEERDQEPAEKERWRWTNEINWSCQIEAKSWQENNEKPPSAKRQNVLLPLLDNTDLENNVIVY